MSTSTKLLTAGGFFSFFAFGFIDNLKGPLLPELLRSGEFSYAQGGVIVMASYVGFIVATLGTGVLADLISNRSVLWLAGICLCIGSVGFGTASSYPGLILFMGVSGVGLGAIELGANGLMIELHSKARGRYLNLLATFHGCGSLLVPLYVAWLIQGGRNWQLVYFSSLSIAVPLLIVFWPFRHNVPAIELEADCEPKNLSGRLRTRDHWDWYALRRDGFTQPMLCYYLLIAAYVAIELGVAAWMMEFLQQDRKMSVGVSSIYLSSFFVLLMLGRFLGAFLIDQLDPLRTIKIAIVASALCLLGGIFGGEELVVLLPISAFFMSIVFPTVTASVTRLHTSNTGTMLGILFACGGIGGALGPYCAGLMSDWVGLKFGLSTSFGFVVLAMLAIVRLQRLKRRT